MDRRWTLKIHYVLDQLLPPVIRDSGWFMKPLLRLALGDRMAIYTGFKQHAHEMSHAEFVACYRATAGVIRRETDLNQDCIDRILTDITATPVLEVGCGNGHLARLMAAGYGEVSALDIAVSAECVRAGGGVHYLSASAERLPFPDKSFGTVVCAHTLEHVRNISLVVSELRRVCRERLIVVVPRQRPYKYTFDLHLHFFPYPYLLVQTMRPETGDYECFDLSGDLYYREDVGGR